MDAAAKSEPSLGELVGALTHDTGLLVRQEVQLASMEMTEKAKKAAADLGLVALGGALAHAGVVVLLAALVLVLGSSLPLYAAAFIVGGGALLAGAALAWGGLAALKRIELAPKETLRTLRDDQAMLKEQLR